MDGVNDHIPTFQERGFPHADFPSGWFQVGWSQGYARGQVVAETFFGQDLVLYRTDPEDPAVDGDLVALDAFCPHMGAHLGHGGDVEGYCLRCPYHGWSWDRDGRNADIPYGDRRSVNAKTRSWPVREVSGIVYLWHAADGSGPSWAPPHMPEADTADYFAPHPWATHREPMRMHPQFAAENFPDLAHMRYVHRWQEIPEIALWREDGPVLQVDYDGLIATPKGSVPVVTENTAYGVGLNVNRVLGALRSTTLGAFTPIDQTRSEGFITVWVAKRDDAATEPDRLARSIAAANTKELFGPDADRRVWEHQRYREHPLVVGYEATYTRAFRAWSRQFYPGSSRPTAVNR
jgi:phenylpropionate dioxygenase-like ring-hydroxylating dioxygenase large terminal subunit